MLIIYSIRNRFGGEVGYVEVMVDADPLVAYAQESNLGITFVRELEYKAVQIGIIYQGERIFNEK